MTLLKEHWGRLQERERHFLLGGAVALLLLGGYGLIWDPYVEGMARLEKEVVEQRALLRWMEEAAAEVQGLRRGRPVKGGSLLALADSTARAAGLGSALKRVEPEGQRGVRVWFEQVPFDDLLRWLDQLSQRGVRLSGLVVERRPEPGRIDARLVLEEAG